MLYLLIKREKRILNYIKDDRKRISLLTLSSFVLKRKIFPLDLEKEKRKKEEKGKEKNKEEEGEKRRKHDEKLSGTVTFHKEG